MALFKKIYMYFIFWLHWIFIAEHGPSLVAVNGGDALMVVQASLIVGGFSYWEAQAVGAQASVVAARGLSSWGS